MQICTNLYKYLFLQVQIWFNLPRFWFSNQHRHELEVRDIIYNYNIQTTRPIPPQWHSNCGLYIYIKSTLYIIIFLHSNFIFITIIIIICIIVLLITTFNLFINCIYKYLLFPPPQWRE